jgi:hypothetical protein
MPSSAALPPNGKSPQAQGLATNSVEGTERPTSSTDHLTSLGRERIYSLRGSRSVVLSWMGDRMKERDQNCR